MRRKIITILAGTLILFLWNAVSWLVLPFHGDSFKSLPAESVDLEAFQREVTEDGVYHFPGFPTDGDPDKLQAIKDQLAKGPRITLMVYRQGPAKLFDPSLFLTNLLLNFLAVIVLYAIASQVAKKTFKRIATTLLLVALVIGLMSDFPQMNWHRFPAGYTFVNVFDHLISIGLLSVLFAKYSLRAADS